jgi:hypothetical protein
MNTPWAALLCKFNDDDSEPFERGFYERLFTTAGSGSLNMVDYFADCSHGNADVSGSEVFGWYTLNKARNEYTGSGPNWQGRLDLVNWARQAATDAGVDLTRFYGVVVCMNVATDLFGGGGRLAVCDLNSMRPALLGQEMGHGYGLAHSRIDGSTDDYRDPWDTMSTASPYSASHDEFGSVGPGLNAWNMRSQGWLDETRVWRGSGSGFNSTIVLRPLHRRDLPGLLAAELPGGYLAEFRVQERWDAEIPRPAILVHRFDDNHSYLMPATAGSSDLAEGDKFERGSQTIAWVGYTALEVQDIDAKSLTATLRVEHTPRQRQPHEFEGIFGQIIGGVGVDGGGILILPGRVVPIPPWDPTIRILEQIAVYRESAHINDSSLQDAVRRHALERIVLHATTNLDKLHVFESPPQHPGELHEHEHEQRDRPEATSS